MRLKGLTVPDDYLEKFDKAFLTFKYQLIYCPFDLKCKHLNDPDDSIHSESLKEHDDLSFLGAIQDTETSRKIANGTIDPITLNELKLDPVSVLLIQTASKIEIKSKRDKKGSSRRQCKKSNYQQNKSAGIRAFFPTASNTKSCKKYYKKQSSN